MLTGMTFWEWIQVAGYFAETVGIGLAVWEILDRGKQLAAFETSQREIEGFMEAILAEALFEASGLVTSATPPTMEERVDALERRVEQDLPRQLKALEKAAAKTAEEQTRRIIRPMQASFQSDLAKLTEALRGTLSGHRRALGGVVLLLFGLALQGVGSIEGAHAATSRACAALDPRDSEALTGLRPSPTSRAVVTCQFSRMLTQGPAVRGADRRHPLRLDMLTMTRSAYLQVRCAVVAQMERAVLTLHRLFGPPRAKLDSKLRLCRT